MIKAPTSVNIYILYIAVSAFALGIDTGCYWLLLKSDVPVVAAGIIGYLTGVVAHWLGSSRLVFSDRVDQGKAAGQKAKFLLTALVGTICNTAIIWLAMKAGFDAVTAKFISIVICFHLTLFWRVLWVFGLAPRSSDQHARVG